MKIDDATHDTDSKPEATVLDIQDSYISTETLFQRERVEKDSDMIRIPEKETESG